MTKKNSLIDIPSPRELIEKMVGNMPQDDKENLIRILEEAEKSDKMDHLRFIIAVEPYGGFGESKSRTVKTSRMICKNWGQSSVDEAATIETEHDKEGRMVYRKCTYNPIFAERMFGTNYTEVVDHYSYDEEGRMVYFIREFDDGSTWKEEFFYSKDKDGNLLTHCRRDDTIERINEVYNSDGVVLFQTLVDFDAEKCATIETSYRYQYDESGRVTDIFSFDPNSMEPGKNWHYEYSDEDGKTITRTSVYALTAKEKFTDKVMYTDAWKRSEEPLEKTTLTESVDEKTRIYLERNDITGKEERTIDHLDEEGAFYKRVFMVFENEKMISKTIYLLDKDEHIIDTLDYRKGALFWHTVNHYSDDGLLLFASHTLIPEKIVADGKQLQCWYEYTFYE